MSNLVGKRFQVVLTLGTGANGAPSFEVAGTEIDNKTLKQIGAHTSMQLVHRALGLYQQVLAQSMEHEEQKPQILIPQGHISGLRGN